MNKLMQNPGVKKLQAYWNENPMQCIVIGAFAVTAAAKLLDATSAAQGRRAYAKQIDYKVRNAR